MFLLYFSAILCVCKPLCGAEGNISSLPLLFPLYALRQHLPLNVAFINLEGWLVPGTSLPSSVGVIDTCHLSRFYMDLGI